MLISVLINYVTGLLINREEGKRRKVALITGLTCNLAILSTFKYLGFFAEILNNIGLNVISPKIALPIGISFYTFQSISYLVDVYRKESPVQHRFIDLLLYISMFPQLIAGPIVRYGTVAKEINDRHVSASDFSEGSFRFILGLGKKVIIANQLSEITDQFLMQGLNSLSTSGAWIGIIAYTLQIYFDFSGYSDMAIGMGRCLGFHFKENFNHPYCCSSITDFWRRWHISLGSFFRDYVYIPMGGNRRHQATNILIVWFLTGMWHGASWNFIIWGVYFGLIVMLEKYTILRIKNKLLSPLFHVYSMVLVIAGWGIFYFDDFHSMLLFFKAFIGDTTINTDFISQCALSNNFWLWVLALLFCLPIQQWTRNIFEHSFIKNSQFKQVIVFCLHITISMFILFCSIALLVGATNNAFIYTRF
jgi:alginate O-acetyltransferase complex protein AlgI